MSRASSTTSGSLAGSVPCAAAPGGAGRRGEPALVAAGPVGGGDGPGSGPGRISSPDMRSWWAWASVMRSAPLPAASAAREASASEMAPCQPVAAPIARRRLRAAAASRRHHRVGRHARSGGCSSSAGSARASSPSSSASAVAVGWARRAAR
ncbi:MAG: hypothetical protein EKK60_11600 [Gordonia sp. (in: high G+C Gram-positive bacteria)]|nr:MAG: hypothetical protein EKK60_11600 [Gordonia sp. (in: high G+C Gram-positive bacteria)]